MKRLSIRGTGISLGLFFDVTFVLCALWAVIVPARLEPMARIWEALLPGFTWLSPASAALALVELFLYGFYVSVVFVPLFNYFEGWRPLEPTEAETHIRREVHAGH